MLKKPLAVIFAGVLLASCAADGPQLGDITSAAQSVLGGSESGPLSTSDITQGLKEALITGSNTVVSQLGQTDGFSGDPTIRIPLPESLLKARDLASKVGLESSFDDLELKLNRAAEAATPKAKELFLGAIREMSVDDAKGILQGPDDAATTYFREKTGASLQTEMQPIVDQALSQVGAVSSFNQLLAKYNNIPFAPKVDADLTGYVVEESSDGIFYYLAQEEKAIRENPLKRTSEILQRVFGNQ